MTTPNKINFPPPKLQIDFAFALKRFRAVYLQSALLETVRDMDIAELDKQLAEYVPPADLATLAQYGLRAELLFAVPAVLEANPYLLGYYRLLMGYSQKEFYGRDKGFGVGYFKSMEEKGKTSKAAAADLPDLCVAFCATASALLAGVGPLRVSRELLDDLTLLTVGPQLRGGANNQRGTDGIVQVFEIIREIVAHAAACYALSGTPSDEAVFIHGRWKDPRDLFWPWTWDRSWWKPTNRRRDLVKAGALILAEIERLDRAAPEAEGGSDER